MAAHPEYVRGITVAATCARDYVTTGPANVEDEPMSEDAKNHMLSFADGLDMAANMMNLDNELGI